jgi:hypothetical protein
MKQSNLVVDDSGKVWFSASSGIYCLSPVTGTITAFTAQDGLPARSLPLQKLDNGYIGYRILSGIYRLTRLPLRIMGSRLTCTWFRCRQWEAVSIQQHDRRHGYHHLGHTENNIAVEFAATDFEHPFATLYSYRLIGARDSWSTPSASRTLNFSQLEPGHYKLGIRAGLLAPEKTLYITIVPAWWQTTLFRFLVFSPERASLSG